MRATVVVPTVHGGDRLRRLLRSLRAQTVEHETIVVDNGSPARETSAVLREFGGVRSIRLETNVGYSRAVNIAARAADGNALVLLNDDSACSPCFVEAICDALDPARDIVMAAGVLADARRPELIETAGMELDATLLVFDYLNGAPTAAARTAPSPIGPSAAAAAFDLDAFMDVGGFDENLFAYWEDVDLVLRLREQGGRCKLAPDAQGVHEHSGTLGSGSSEKDYLTGFGRGYVLRKWSVVKPRRLPQVVARDLAICAGQLVVDRTAAGFRGRRDGWRAARAVARFRYPSDALESRSVPAELRRRFARRRRLGSRATRS